MSSVNEYLLFVICLLLPNAVQAVSAARPISTVRFHPTRTGRQSSFASYSCRLRRANATTILSVWLKAERHASVSVSRAVAPHRYRRSGGETCFQDSKTAFWHGKTLSFQNSPPGNGEALGKGFPAPLTSIRRFNAAQLFMMHVP